MLHFDEKTLDLRAFSRIRALAIGKAAHAMLEGLRSTLPAELEFDGVASAPTGPSHALPGIKYFVGGHPIPNADSWNSGQAILSLLADCDESTLVFFLLSGGGSALSEVLLDSRLTLEDLQQFYGRLVTCGASIGAINTVRKHFSAVKGGRMAAAAGARAWRWRRRRTSLNASCERAHAREAVAARSPR